MNKFFAMLKDSYKEAVDGWIFTVMLVLAGIAFYHPGWTLKLVILIYFVLMTNPISSHALARAAHAIGIPMAPETGRDALRETRQPDEAKS